MTEHDDEYDDPEPDHQDLRAKNQCAAGDTSGSSDISRHSSDLQRRLAGAPPARPDSIWRSASPRWNCATARNISPEFSFSGRRGRCGRFIRRIFST